MFGAILKHHDLTITRVLPATDYPPGQAVRCKSSRRHTCRAAVGFTLPSFARNTVTIDAMTQQDLDPKLPGDVLEWIRSTLISPGTFTGWLLIDLVWLEPSGDPNITGMRALSKPHGEVTEAFD